MLQCIYEYIGYNRKHINPLEKYSMYLDPNSQYYKEAARLRSEELARLCRKFINLFRKTNTTTGESK